MTRTERTYYVIDGLYHASWFFMGPVYPLFLLHHGLDLFQVNVVLAVYFLASFLFEVPTGAVADRFGRKASFLASCLIRCSAFVLYWFSSSFPAFLFAELVDAIGTTLATGALDAWAVDGMRAEGSRRTATRLFANGNVIARGAIIASGLTGAYLADVDIALPWAVGAAGFLITTAVGAAFMQEHAPETPLTERASTVRTIRESARILRGSGMLRLVCIVTAVTAFAYMPAMIFWAPRLEQLVGPGMWLMGWVWVLLNVVAAGGSGFVSRLGPEAPAGKVLAIVTGMRAIGLGVAALTGNPAVVVAGILALEGGSGAMDPLLQARMSDGALPSHRATILSLRAMAFTCGGALGLVLLGLSARGFGIPLTWCLAGGVLVVAIPFFPGFDRQAGISRRATPGKGRGWGCGSAPGIAGKDGFGR